jgi:hypothetical protein
VVHTKEKALPLAAGLCSGRSPPAWSCAARDAQFNGLSSPERR